VIAKELEAAADDAAVMAQAVKELLVKGFDLDGPLMGGLKEFNNEVKGLFTNALAALLTRDLRLANQTVTARKRLRARQDQLGTILANRARDPFVVLRLRTILDALSRTADISTSIANIAFNRYLERSTAVCREQVLKA
jgi:Na+/phosphate symporter